MNEYSTPDRALSWDDVIDGSASQQFTLLPAGDYDFVVSKMERARHQGSAKLPPCDMAVLTLSVDGGVQGKTTVTERLYLHTKTQGLLCAFFISIGQMRPGETTLRPNWSQVPGSRGRVKIYVDEYVDKNGAPAQSNKVKRFLAPAAPAAAAAPAPAQGWSQGRF